MASCQWEDSDKLLGQEAPQMGKRKTSLGKVEKAEVMQADLSQDM